MFLNFTGGLIGGFNWWGRRVCKNALKLYDEMISINGMEEIKSEQHNIIYNHD